MKKVSLHALYIINNNWNPNTILIIDSLNNIERMPAQKAVEKYGKMGVHWFIGDYIFLCCKGD